VTSPAVSRASVVLAGSDFSTTSHGITGHPLGLTGRSRGRGAGTAKMRYANSSPAVADCAIVNLRALASRPALNVTAANERV